MANGMFAGGNGAANDPFLIEDAADLDAIRRNPAACYKLINHINLGVPPYNIGNGWDPIKNFTGKLNGNKKKIFNLYINRIETDFVGLFGLTENLAPVTIKEMRIYDLAIENADVTGKDLVGILFGYIAAGDRTRIPDDPAHTVFNRISCSGKVSGNTAVGGILGRAHNHGSNLNGYGEWPVLINSIAKGVVESRAKSGAIYAGGIIGRSDSNYPSSVSCSSSVGLAKVTNSNFLQVGSAINGGPKPGNSSMNVFDVTLNAGLTVTPGSVGLTTNELKNGDTRMKHLIETLNGTESVWRIEPDRLPELAFMRTDCFFVKANGDYLTWDATQKKWVKQFDVLPSTPEIWKLGMKSIAELDTAMWSALKPYGKVDIINFVNQTEKLNVEDSVGKLTKQADQPIDSKICFSKKFLFADYRNDVVSITS